MSSKRKKINTGIGKRPNNGESMRFPPPKNNKQERHVQHPFGGQGGGGGRVLTVHDRWNKELKIQLLLSRKKHTFLLLFWPRFVNERFLKCLINSRRRRESLFSLFRREKPVDTFPLRGFSCENPLRQTPFILKQEPCNFERPSIENGGGQTGLGVPRARLSLQGDGGDEEADTGTR